MDERKGLMIGYMDEEKRGLGGWENKLPSKSCGSFAICEEELVREWNGGGVRMRRRVCCEGALEICECAW